MSFIVEVSKTCRIPQWANRCWPPCETSIKILLHSGKLWPGFQYLPGRCSWWYFLHFLLFEKPFLSPARWKGTQFVFSAWFIIFYVYIQMLPTSFVRSSWLSYSCLLISSKQSGHPPLTPDINRGNCCSLTIFSFQTIPMVVHQPELLTAAHLHQQSSLCWGLVWTSVSCLNCSYVPTHFDLLLF